MLELTEAAFREGGWLSEKLPGYRNRPGQLSLVQAVRDAIENERHLLAEAPTGTGKSMAFGVPAAIWAMSHNRRVVVVTSNITLQEQLLKKDLPLIADVLRGKVKNEEGDFVEFKYSLLKGMGNYVCPVRLDASIDELKEYEQPVPEWMLELKAAVSEDFHGNRSEMDKVYADEDWWKINTSTKECLRNDCPYNLDDMCPYFKAKRVAHTTHLVVTNYHMFFSDIRVKNMTGGAARLIPEYDLVVFDEAHDAPFIAMDFQGFQLYPASFSRVVKRLRKLGNDPKFYELEARIKDATKLVFDDLYKRQRNGTRILEEPLKYEPAKTLINLLFDAAELFRSQAKQMKEDSSSPEAIRNSRVRKKRIAGTSEQCVELAATLQEVYGEESFEKSHVYYLEPDFRTKTTALCCKVVGVESFFQDNVFEETPVIAVSATLATNNSFKFVAKQFGLKNKDYASLIAPTPFDPGRVLAIVPEEPFPEPRDKASFQYQVSETVALVAEMLEGHTMALFTSYENLRFCADVVRGTTGLEVLMQGDMPKMQIIQRFKENPDNSIIMATASFWQGVDIPGDALTCVIIDKIPFARPDDPVLYYIENRTDGNGFFDYSIPRAIIALKQGIGRLIRTEEDYGAVVVLDVRINTKRYGEQIFSSSFPINCFGSEDVKDIPEFFEQFKE